MIIRKLNEGKTVASYLSDDGCPLFTVDEYGQFTFAYLEFSDVRLPEVLASLADVNMRYMQNTLLADE